MPKIIPGLQEKILQTARTILLEEEDSAFSMRSIAERCGIACGTIYNYFPGKDSMLAAILMHDWMDILERMHASVQQAQSFSAGIRSMYDIMSEFVNCYRGIWLRYSGSARDIPMQDKRHEQMILQIKECVSELLARFAPKQTQKLARLLSESILTSVLHKSITWDELHTLCTYIVKE